MFGCVSENDTNTYKKIFDMNTEGSCHCPLALDFFFCFRYVHNWDKIAPWIFFEVWALLISFEVFFFFFFFKSVWSWKLAWMSALLCPLNFASSFIRNSHHQYVFFFSPPPPPVHSFKWVAVILFFHFSPVFSFYFSCACVSQCHCQMIAREGTWHATLVQIMQRKN